MAPVDPPALRLPARCALSVGHGGAVGAHNPDPAQREMRLDPG